ncbi:unnamed protein product, partial [Onchocerca ochengi]
DVTEPTNDVTEPTNDVTEPANDVTKPANDVTEPVDDVTKPANDVTEPTDDVTEPANDVTVPTGDVTEATNDVTEPTNDVTEPTNDVTVPTGDITVPADITTQPTTLPGECYDRIPNCLKYNFLCKNDLYQPLMSSLCQLTCGYCEISSSIITPEICQDLAAPDKPSDCPLHSNLCNHPIYKELMKEQCPKTCGFCDSTISTTSTSPICEDKKGIDGRSNCNDLRYLCCVPLYMPLISVQCPRTCGLC